MFSRRKFLHVSGLGALSLVAGGAKATGRARSTAQVPYFCFITQTSEVAVPRFVRGFRRPPVLAPVLETATTDYYSVTMRPGTVKAVPHLTTPIHGYEGIWPGPTIRARVGRRAVVRQINDLDVETAVHLHGAHVAPEHDGYPLDMIAPGSERTYNYPNKQRAATNWYHDHALMATGPNVYRGLAGFYLLEDPADDVFNLPVGRYDVPVGIADRVVLADGRFWYPSGPSDGMLGDVMFVNGVAYPRMKVATRRYRLRLLNMSNCRLYELALSDGRGVVQVASDGGLLAAPVARNTVLLAPGERSDVIVDFTGDALGTQVVLQNILEEGGAGEIMRFDVTRVSGETSEIPAAFRPIPALGPPVQTREFALQFDPDHGWVFDRGGFDPGRVDASPRRGDSEVWQFHNQTGLAHPLHIHHSAFQLLDRDGVPAAPHESGWKDTVLVSGGETVRLAVRFDDYRGIFVYHCHNLEHEDHDMMNQFEVI